MVQLVGSLLLGYLVGALPTGVVVARLWGGVDLTTVGSKRTGATNVLRTLGPAAAAAVFVGDFAKGALAVLLASALTAGDLWAMAGAGLAAVIGHAYSPFIGFKGGRGVATGLGALAVLSPAAAVLAVLAGAVAIALTRYVSLGSILGTLTAAVVLIVWALSGGHHPAYVLFGLSVSAFILFAHRDNIGRLLHGTERRLGQRAEVQSPEA
jgi:glycerol-3-phosphate acyltransferase PlsY